MSFRINIMEWIFCIVAQVVEPAVIMLELGFVSWYNEDISVHIWHFIACPLFRWQMQIEDHGITPTGCMRSLRQLQGHERGMQLPHSTLTGFWNQFVWGNCSGKHLTWIVKIGSEWIKPQNVLDNKLMYAISWGDFSWFWNPLVCQCDADDSAQLQLGYFQQGKKRRITKQITCPSEACAPSTN